MGYYEFCESIRFSLPWQSLKYKNENNIESNEFLFYQLLDDEASSFALKANLNYHLVSCLARVHGFCFGDYGIACWKVIKKFLNDIDFKTDINVIKSTIVKRAIKSVKEKAPEEFLSYIDELFSENPKTTEVKLVKEFHKVLKTLQPLKNKDIKLFYELEDQALEEIKQHFLANNEIIEIDVEKYIPNDMERLTDTLDEDTFKQLYDELAFRLKKYNEKYPEVGYEDNVISAISYVLAM